jgi:L-alanine-DL-glutamate epimerase-like enolase superfamily enzyme
VTDLPLAVDANQGWTDRFQALDMIYWLKEHGVVLVEQPLPVNRYEDLAWLKERSPLPLFGDESVQGLSDVRRALGLFHGINIKLMKCGGLRAAHKMIDLARSLGLKVMLGCMTETSCAVSAAAQLSPAVDFADLDGNLLISNDLFDGVGLAEGKLVLPDRPGIGVTKL